MLTGKSLNQVAHWKCKFKNRDTKGLKQRRTMGKTGK